MPYNMIIVSGGLLSKEAVPLIVPLMISNRTKVFTINSLRTESDFLCLCEQLGQP